jgi:23S rRNA (guanosine2251-2'-O)-methyltransferase
MDLPDCLLKHHRDEMKNEILYGIHPVEEALRAGRRRFDEIFLVSQRPSKRLQAIEDSAALKNIPLQRVSDARLSRLSEEAPHQGVAARVGRFPLVNLASLISGEQIAAGGRLLVLLDSIVDPHNLGAIIRTALGVGVEAVIIPKNRAAGPTPTVSKASAGALEHIRLIEVTNLAEAIKTLKSSGWWVYGMVHSAGDSVFSKDLTGMVAIVIGGEERGIRPLVKQNCDFLLTIPQQGQVTSLNASVAAAVVMFEVYRQCHDTHTPRRAANRCERG